MPQACRYKLQQLATAATISIVTLVANSGIALAAYGPPAPSPAPVPGDFYCVVTSQIVGPAGKLIGPLRLGGLKGTIRASRGTFAIPSQITVTEPYAGTGNCRGGPGIGTGGFPGYRAVGGVGILVQVNGSAYLGTFVKSLVLRLAARSIGRSTLVVVRNGTRFLPAPGATVRRRFVTVRVDANSDLAVLAPARHSRRLDATTAFILRSAGWPVPGLDVAPGWLTALGTRGPGADPLTSGPRS